MTNVKILMLGEYDKAMYHPMAAIDELFRTEFCDFSFVFSDDADELENASGYDIIISYWDDWNTGISDEAATALEQYVSDGGCLLVLHNGISLQLRENLMNMIGAKFITHPVAESIMFIPINDPYVKDVPAFEIVEEPYQFEMIPDNKEIFLNYIYKNSTYPAGWKKDYGKGKVVYLCPGHTILSFKVDGYMTLIRNCLDQLKCHINHKNAE